ncbi:MAG: tetratricopeptide repeat protein [Candidatus Berkelbacteria bacterium]|nr:tetratricopeptide repeat protein [Candidatus Berkelbacteria bacterium]
MEEADKVKQLGPYRTVLCRYIDWQKLKESEQDEIDVLPEIDELIKETTELCLLFEEAERLSFAGTEDEAFKLYSQIVSRRYESLYGHLAAGQLAVLRGRGGIETALNEFTQAKECEQRLLQQQIIACSEDRVNINLGLTYRKLDLYTEAIEAFSQVNPKEREAKNAFAFAGISSVYRDMSSDQKIDSSERDKSRAMAIKYAEMALGIDADLSYAKTGLANIYFNMGKKGDPTKIELARQLAEEVIESKPNDWYSLGLLANLHEAKDPAKAEEFYQRAVSNAPAREGYVRVGYARLLKNRQPKPDFATAERLLREAIAADPANITAQTDLADVLRNQGNLKEAREQALFVLNLLSDTPDRQSYVRVILSRVEFALGHIQAAFQAIAPAKTLMDERQKADPNVKPDTKILNVLGKIRAEQAKAEDYYLQAQTADADGDTMKAVECLRAVIDRNPYFKGFKAYWILAEIMIGEKRYKEAYEASEMALRNGEKGGFSEIAMARALYNAGREEDALIAIRKGIAKNAQSTFRFDRDLENRISEISMELEQRWGRTAGKKRIEIGSGHQLFDNSPHFVFMNAMTGHEEWHSSEKIRQFLNFVLKTQNLPMGQFDQDSGYVPIDMMGDKPVFLVAKTGVGKTVSVPTKILISHMDTYFKKAGIVGGTAMKDKYPQVYVVVPRIPIAQSQMNFMNSQYQEFLKISGAKDARNYYLFGSISSAGKRNDKAPILFVTTGIFESMAFNDQFDPDLHRVIIDEAHVTIEQNPGVEIGIAIACAKKVMIDYMSATVETSTLKADLQTEIVVAGKDRYPIMMRNLGGTVEDNLLQMIDQYLINPKEEYYPDRHDPKYGSITVDLFDNRHGRPRGLLVIVNSHQGAASDTLRFCKLIEEAEFNWNRKIVSAFSYAAPVARNKAAEDRFRRQIEAVEKQNGLYVIVATNVVEMGVTFDSLDYLMTMDSEFVTTYVDGGQLIDAVPLGINALYQRIGRVGRKRGGIAFIADEIGAPYAKLPDKELRKGLPCQRIGFPIAKGNVQKLALYSYKQGWSEPLKSLSGLVLPSLRTAKVEVEKKFTKERDKIARMGLTDNYELNEIGERSLSYLSVENLDYKRLLALAEKSGSSELTKVIMIGAAAADLSLGQFLHSGTSFTVTDDSGAKDSLHINQYVTIEGEADPVLVQKLVAEHRGDDLINCLVNVSGLTNSDAGIILNYLEDDYLLAKIEPETEIGEDGVETTTGIGLFFDKNAVLADPDCEIVTIYRIISYFYNRFVLKKKMPGLSRSNISQIDAAMDQEIDELGLNPMNLRTVLKNFEDLSRQMMQSAAKDTEKVVRIDKEKAPKESERLAAFTSQLMEKVAEKRLDFPIDLIEELAKNLLALSINLRLRENADNIKAEISDMLQRYGYVADSRITDTLLRDLIRPAYGKYLDEISPLEYNFEATKLPFITESLRRRVINFLRENNFGQEITLTFYGKEAQLQEQGSADGKPYYMTWVGRATSENGQDMDILVRPFRTSLLLPLSENRPIKVRGRLVPAYFTEAESEKDIFVRGGKRLASFLRKKQRVFELLHITILD